MVENIKRNWFIYLFLITITLTVYSRVTDFKFVHYDDNVYVIDNDHVKTGLTADNIRWAFAGKYEANWMPLTWVSFMADHEIAAQSYSAEFESDENPSIYHQTNLLLHILNTLLLFFVLNALTGFRWRSAMVAAIFAVHPLHVESVAWIAERKDVLSTLFMILTLWSYLWYAKKPGIERYSILAAAFGLGLMCKSMLVTLPIILLLLDFWPLRRIAGITGDKERRGEPFSRLVLEKVPLFALALAAGVVAIFAQERGNSLATLTDYPVGVRIANAFFSYIAYIDKIFWPVNLACPYPHPHNSLPVLLVIGSALLLGALTFVAIRVARRFPYITMGWLWYVITLLPVIGIIQVGYQAIADRYTYIPMIGFSIAVVWGIAEFVGNNREKMTAAAAVSCIVLLCLICRAYSQVGFWQNDYTLFGHAIEVTPPNAVAQYNYAVSLIADGKNDASIPHLREAIRIDPNKADAHNNLGGILLSHNDINAALKHFKIAVRISPNYIDAQSNLAKVLMNEGKVDEAIIHLKIVHRLDPNDEEISQALADAKAIIK